MHSMDRLWEAVEERGPVCVGLDTAPEYIPPRARGRAVPDTEAVLEYNRAVVDATIDAAACYKVQIAYYEAMGLPGLRVYAETLSYLRGKKVPVIADIKRGDIADTARRYAAAHFSGDFEADFVTLSPYMGMDSLEAWLEYTAKGKGAFVLVRTTNPGMKDFEWLELAEEASSGGDGVPAHPPSPEPRRLYGAVAEKLSALAEKHAGAHGYGAFGAVVGCTEREESRRLRERHEKLFFLIPGYGAQGGAAEDAALLLKNGNGGVVNASRSILQAWKKRAAPEDSSLEDAARAAREETLKMRDAIRAQGAGKLP